MKFFGIVFGLLFCPFFLFGVDIYTVESAKDMKKVKTAEFKNYHDVVKYLEKRFSMELQTTEIRVGDSNNNDLLILEVNIITDLPIQKIFGGPAHMSILIKETEYNLIQPGSSRWDWNVHAIILKLNGVFTQMLDYDRVYDTVVTQSMLLGW